ncbi:hypothetical protein B9T10_03505 [Wohlfahrtiimonas chitiniclastica]|uniref:SMI1/KNR4 family protein n=1 Tax=Wohlfahrtiimonas chitiniclastica TaxID=400946 RepID=UPI000B98BF46|nr:SMI1/KNR4 family protein [Wohlfahrtiimonas chitiniclastica]OYQ71767.1 hypothetical protein B9T13_03600 [Wohlfahrtiimonas chitiniclastica]OYQ90398.1 hypothetical protein B9T10_03505 [Wohlfahrtiimonas chitiniclastica]
MDKLLEIIKENDAVIRPASAYEIEKLKKDLGMDFSAEYEQYLSILGSVQFESCETYGFDVNDGSYSKLVDIYNDLSTDEEYPNSAVPLMKVDEDSYYLYDNSTEMMLEWLGDYGGVSSTLHEDIEEFIIKYLFNN